MLSSSGQNQRFPARLSLAWHEWRKQVKYLRYQLKIVRRSWRTPLDSWRRDLNRLSDLIGLDHDLVELLQLLSRQGVDMPSPEALKHPEQLCEERS
jgi:CHAD domain-containing protein